MCMTGSCKHENFQGQCMRRRRPIDCPLVEEEARLELPDEPEELEPTEYNRNMERWGTEGL